MGSNEQSERGDEEDAVCLALSEIQNECDIHDIAKTQAKGDEGDIHNDIIKAIDEAEP